MVSYEICLCNFIKIILFIKSIVGLFILFWQTLDVLKKCQPLNQSMQKKEDVILYKSLQVSRELYCDYWSVMTLVHSGKL